VTENPAAIEVQVTSLEQLFNSLDPFPFRERDLDRSAEEFIVGWARELPSSRPIEIIIHVPAGKAPGWSAADIEDSFHRYFEYRAEIVGRDLSELFRVGRRSLQIGVAVLLVSVGLSELSNATFGHEGIFAVINEGLIILGWVANWRPIEIFLYEWWPVAGHRALFRRLAKARVRFALPGDPATRAGAETDGAPGRT
jgi:hypothetical protein